MAMSHFRRVRRRAPAAGPWRTAGTRAAHDSRERGAGRMPRVIPAGPAEHVLEVVTPRTNVARLSSAEHLFSTLVHSGQGAPEPVSLEIVGDADQRRFFARASGADELRRVAGQLGAAYPQAELRP